ncbi:hypothetical protein BDV12DRAFT_199909 [Aspergillus spectabilis]
MSRVEILGNVAAAIQIAELGSRLSMKLYTHHHKLKNADKSIRSLSRDVALTCNVMQQLGDSLNEDSEAQLHSPEAFSTAQEVLDECQGVYKDIDNAIRPTVNEPKPSRLVSITQRFSDVRRDSYLAMLGSNLERLKSTMLFMLNVIIYARQICSKKEDKVLFEPRDLFQIILDEKAATE